MANATTTPAYDRDGVKAFVLVIYPLMLLCGCAANAVCLLGVARMPSPQRVFVLSVNLWLVNLVLCLTVFPLNIAAVLWMDAYDTCKWTSVVGVAWEIVTLTTLSMMAIERFSKVRFAITRKLSFTGRIYEKNWPSSVAWVLGACVALLAGLLGDQKHFPAGAYCGLHRVMPHEFTFSYTCLGVILPLAMLTVLDLLFTKMTFRHARTVDVYGTTDFQPPTHDLVDSVQGGYGVFRVHHCILATWIPMVIATLMDTRVGHKQVAVSHDLKLARNWLLHVLEFVKYLMVVIGPLVVAVGGKKAILHALRPTSLNRTAHGEETQRSSDDGSRPKEAADRRYRHREISYNGRHSFTDDGEGAKETVELSVFITTETRPSAGRRPSHDKSHKYRARTGKHTVPEIAITE